MITVEEYFTKFPCMKPRVGEFYQSDKHKKLLVLGESHYLPPESKDKAPFYASDWYKLDQSKLSDTERGYISTKEIIDGSVQYGLKNKAHTIYREICKALRFGNITEFEGIDHCIFTNYFLRPAVETGGSIQVNYEDYDLSREYLLWLVETYKPDLIMILSSKVFNMAYSKLEELKDPNHFAYAFAPNPGCKWWNRKAKRYGYAIGKGGEAVYGRDVFPEFLKRNNWINS